MIDDTIISIHSAKRQVTIFQVLTAVIAHHGYNPTTQIVRCLWAISSGLDVTPRALLAKPLPIKPTLMDQDEEEHTWRY